MIPPGTADALDKLAARADEHRAARPDDYVRYELSFDTSRPMDDTWAAEFDSGWDHCSIGFGPTALDAVEQCFDILEAQQESAE